MVYTADNPGVKRPQIRHCTKRGIRVKRCLDIVLSIIGLLILLPIFLVVSILVPLDSKGGAFFAQTRIGAGGRRFKMLKFRSMFVDAEQRLGDPNLARETEAAGRILKLKHDPRVTRLGRVLRSTSIDELPQFVNVLLGHMSIVGPRALVPSMLDPFPEWAEAREVVPPGITGLWQVSARDRNESLADMIDYDLEYIHTWSLWNDLVIMARTPKALISRKGAI